MQKIVLYSSLLVVGLISSQIVPGFVGEQYGAVSHIIKLLTMLGLGFIMIHVGYEFEIDKSNLKQYGWDYVVAATAAAFPWIFCALYFVFVMSPSIDWASWDIWKDSLLASRFAAPTSAGVLFSMLAAAGLAATWLYRKTRILAIFDDLDTVLLMIPLKMMIVGVRWQLGVIVLLMLVMIWLAWKYLHLWRIPMTWQWVLGYAAAITLVSELIYLSSKLVDEVVPIHIEVLLPAFVLGCMAAKRSVSKPDGSEVDQLETATEKRASTAISAVFMVLVGLSMPPLQSLAGTAETVQAADVAIAKQYTIDAEPAVSTDQPMSWGMIALHVLLVTLISNIGKLFPAFCYRNEANWRERLAVSVAMFPRGEVGAGVLVISMSYGIGGPMITVAMFSLALNLLLTGVFIWIVLRLINQPEDRTPASSPDKLAAAAP